MSVCVEHLTPREEEVLGMVAAGLTDRQIAAHLGVGYSTVRTHRGNAYEKLDLHSAEDVRRWVMNQEIGG